MKKLKKISDWLSKNGYRLIQSNLDFVDYTNKEVHFCSRLSDKNKIFSILHECGHIVVSKKRNYSKMYKAVEKSYFDSRIKRSDLFKYQHIKEEIDAWQRGLKLAKSLNIKIDKDEYEKYAAKCVKTYIQLYGTK